MAAGAIVCLLAILLAGCRSAEPTPTPEPVTIHFVCPAFIGPEAYEPLVQEFNQQYPYITVEVEGDYWYGGTGNPMADYVDAVELWDSPLRDMHRQGKTRDLGPFIEQDPSFDLADFYPAMLDFYTDEGSVWAIPSGVDLVAMFYNKDLFDQYDVPYPEVGWTWDDFLSKAQALRDPDAGVYAYTHPDYTESDILAHHLSTWWAGCR